MTRAVCLSCLAILLFAGTHISLAASGLQTQDQKTSPPPAATRTPAQSTPAEEMPPEEDESVAPEKFVLNPLESDRNVRVGNYYWRKGNYRAALGRYERATKFNPSSAEAFFKVGEAEEKLKNKAGAKMAFQKVIQLAPDSKLAHDAKKKLGG